MPKLTLMRLMAVLLLMVLCVTRAGAIQDALFPQYETFTRIVNEIQDKYVDEKKAKDVEGLFEGAYKGMLAELDPYSQFINKRMYQEFNIDVKQEFGGLGIKIDLPHPSVLIVITPMFDTPAWHAGVMPGDRIIKINGESTEDIRNIYDAIDKLRGKVGTAVTITVVRQDSSKPRDITITRAKVKPPSVEYEMVDETAKIGHIWITSFGDPTVAYLGEAVEELQKKGMKALILDVRNNPGGLLDTAIRVADKFITKGDIVLTKGRDRAQDQTYTAHPGVTYPNWPMVVLVNGQSASASEIVAGVIKDHNRGLLIGERTYGKGSVQSVIPLEDGSVALKLTTAKYYTPAHKVIDGKGIEPDITIRYGFGALREYRLQKEIKRAKKRDERSEENGGTDRGERRGKGSSADQLTDPQLQCAIDVLKGIQFHEKIAKANSKRKSG